MASAQVLPSSRKQELAEAGRRKLEQFRKQRAAERSKKTSSNSRPQLIDGTTEHPRVTESDGAVTSKSNGPVGINISNNKRNEFSQESHQASSNESHINMPFLGNEYNISSIHLEQKDASNQELQKGDISVSVGAGGFYNSTEIKDSRNDSTFHSRLQESSLGRSTSSQFSGTDKRGSKSYNSVSIQSSFHGLEDSISKESDASSKVSPQTTASSLLLNMSGHTDKFDYGHGLNPSYEESLQPTTRTTGSVSEAGKSEHGSVEFKEIKVFNSKGQKPITSASSLFTLQDISLGASESSRFGMDGRNSLPLYPIRNEMNARRSRPSFLDSLNIPRASSETQYQHSEIEKGSTMSNGSQSNGVDGLGSSTFQNSSSKTDSVGLFSKQGTSSSPSTFERSGNSLVSVANGSILGLHDFPPPKQNEDFAALEQHIEDLTQEKFSLQKALEASRVLAESLASENSSLTDSYNQQRSVVNQLRADMEKLKEEVQAQMVGFESVRNEYANAQLECNAADERAKILASEVIVLEEKALRLRSNELKLERELENAQAELSSYKKKISSIEKDRQDLQSTINRLQEEKKVLQSKLRKVSSGGKSIDYGKSPISRKDMSTSTEDLDSIAEGSSYQETHCTAQLESDASSFTMLSEKGQSDLEAVSVNIPANQMRMIQNIDTLISELALEKEELVQALSFEQSQSAKLKELNKELSKKFEAQTQRLELLTAKHMANDNNTSSTRQPKSIVVQDSTPYADEGDEVVERVLGWIMKLFPGGPSRRRTSKLL